MSNYIDTRDLIEERDTLKQDILDSFLETFPHYEDMTDTFEDIRFEEEEIESWKEDWRDELNAIRDTRICRKVSRLYTLGLSFGRVGVHKR